MSLMPRRSTERIADEFLPGQAEQEWITKFRPRTADLLLLNIARSCCDGFRPTDDEAQCCLNVLNRSINERDGKAEVLATWILGFTKPSLLFTLDAQEKIIRLASPAGLSYKRLIENLHDTFDLSGKIAICIGAVCGMIQSLAWTGHLLGIEIIAGIFIGGFIGGLLGSFLTPFISPIMAIVRKRQEREIQKAALYTLRRWNDPRFLGTLAHASIKADAATLKQIQAVFASLQTHLTREHYGLMPAGTTDDLCRALEANEEFLEPNTFSWDYAARPTPHVFFAQNLLRALEKVGSGHAAKYVRAVIEANYHGEVTELAKRILPILTEREQEETARTTLLRHSALPASADELLRAANPSSTENDTETLMRPVL